MKKRPPRGDYEVGYGKPPKHGQFKKGQSGNPKGRRKKADFRTPFERTMQKLVPIKEDGIVRRVPVEEAIMMSVANNALKGNTRLLLQLLKLMEERGRLEPEEQQTLHIVINGVDADA